MEIIFKNKVARLDCIHFKGDRPCDFHKKEGVVCKNCPYYQREGKRVLIIKLGAAGDVLRTTSILPSILRNYPNCKISWLVLKEFSTLLENNPYIYEIIFYEEPYVALSDQFDIGINLDLCPSACSLFELCKVEKRYGFGIFRGKIYPLSESAFLWFFMSIDDKLKRENRKTYHEIINEIAQLPYCGERPTLFLEDSERSWAYKFLGSLGVDLNKPIVGINTGAGKRWEKKVWKEESFCRLIKMLYELGVQVLLLGGKDEIEKNSRLRKCAPLVFDTQARHSLREFASIISACDLLVTGDTMALHMGVCLGKSIVALFGPTSPFEIDLFKKGKKIYPQIECLCCYKNRCDRSPDCMDMIKVEDVFLAIEELLNLG